MKSYFLRTMLLLGFALSLSLAGHAQNSTRQDEVAKRGADVMPFNHLATLHVFAKTDDGGTMRIIVRDPSAAQQIRMVRVHLQDMQARFANGDYSGPSHTHGDDMPGLGQLKSAKPGQISVSYHEVADGAELQFRTAAANLISALHVWIDAQLSDHGKDAMAGQQHDEMPKK
jgi:hypothetical protein